MQKYLVLVPPADQWYKEGSYLPGKDRFQAFEF